MGHMGQSPEHKDRSATAAATLAAMMEMLATAAAMAWEEATGWRRGKYTTGWQLYKTHLL